LAGPDLSIDLNAGCVEVRCARKPPRIALVLAKAPAPNAPKTCDSDQHFCHAPFQRLFFLSFGIQIFLQPVDVTDKPGAVPFASADTVSPVLTPELRGAFSFFDRASRRMERSATNK